MQLSLCMVHANDFDFSSNSEDFSIIVLIRSFQINIRYQRFKRLRLCQTSRFKRIFSCFCNKSNKFSCLGECCKTVLLRSCRKVLWTTEIHLALHLHGVNRQ